MHHLAKRVTPTVATVLVGFFVGYIAMTGTQTVLSDVACQTINNPQTPTGSYGSPFSFQSTEPTLLIRANCNTTTNSATITLGTGSSSQFIYKYAYQEVDGSWEKIALTGEKLSGPWFVGSAVAHVERDHSELAQNNRFLAYICERVGAGYKCGCKDKACNKAYWQLQEFSLAASDTSMPEEKFVDTGELYVQEASKLNAYRGESVTLTGGGFSASENVVYLDDERVAEVNSDGEKTSFLVPSDTEPGMHRVHVKRKDGSEAMGPMLIVREPGAQTPTIHSVTPATGEYGTVVTIRGEHFSEDNNTVLYGYGVEHDVPSKDGTTIEFSVEPFKGELPASVLANIPSDTGYEIPVYLLVANEGGITEEGFLFTLKP